MNKLLILIFLLAPYFLVAQQVGVINDPDGYTNIREGQGTNHHILGRVNKNEVFRYYADDNSNWWRVETMPYEGEPLTGYIHNTRIQSKKLNTTSCGCVQPWGKIDDDPDFASKLGNTYITICGYIHERINESSLKISEFSITDCGAGNMMAFYGATKTCIITDNGNELEITLLDRLPVGKNFEWIETPYKRRSIEANNGYVRFSEEEYVLDLTAISNSEVIAFEEQLLSYKGKGFFDQLETFIGKLLVCTLKGSDKSEQVFNDLDNYIGFVIDGATREFYNDASRIIDQEKSR